jgi:RNA polymerase sigma-70 factor (family 1)
LDNISDIDLGRCLERLAADDAEAFSDLYALYWERLFSIAFHRLADRAEAEDVVHDVFMSLWTHRHLKDISDLDRYLAVAVKYAVLARIRNQRKRSLLLQGFGLPAPSSNDGSEKLDQKLLIERLQGEVERLPDRCRLIFKYSREAGMPVREIAEVLHISPRTVEHQLSKALRRLRFAMRSFLSIFL